MKNFVLGLTAIAGIAASANAAWGYKYEFSTDGGATYGAARAIDTSGGDVNVRFRVVAYVDPNTPVTTAAGTGQAVAFGRITGSEKLTGWGGAANGDAFVGAMTRGAMTNGNAEYLQSSLSAGNTILGTTTALSFASQLLTSGPLANYCPSSDGVPQYEWVIRTGQIKVGQLGGTRVITFGQNSRTATNTNLWYHDVLTNGVQDVSTGVPQAEQINVDGVLTVVPAPGSLALVGLGGLVAARRRRA